MQWLEGRDQQKFASRLHAYCGTRCLL